MTYGKGGRMPNSKGGSKHSDTDSGSMGSNSGSTGGLQKKSDMRADVVKKPTTTNRYPNGMA